MDFWGLFVCPSSILSICIYHFSFSFSGLSLFLVLFTYFLLGLVSSAGKEGEVRYLYYFQYDIFMYRIDVLA